MASQHDEAAYVDMVRDIVLSRVDRSKVTVFLFGSRGRGDHAPRADVDIGFFCVPARNAGGGAKGLPGRIHG